MRRVMRIFIIVTICTFLVNSTDFKQAAYAASSNATEIIEIGESLLPPPSKIPQTFFISDWAKSEFETAISYGLVNQYLVLCDHSKNISREDFCSLVVNIYNKMTGTEYTANIAKSPFKDSSNPQVLTAYELGIVNGTDQDLFSPKENITREQIAKMLTNLLIATDVVEDYKLKNNDIISALEDSDAISDWATEYIIFMLSNKYMKGVSETAFAPQDLVSGEQAIIIGTRLFTANLTEKSIKPNSIQITAPTENHAILTNDLNVTWKDDNQESEDSYHVWLVPAGENYPLLESRTDKNSVSFSSQLITDGNEYIILVRSDNGVCSMPVAVKKGDLPRSNSRLHIKITGYDAAISWQGTAGAAEYRIKIQEDRFKDLDIVGNGPLHEFSTAECTMNFTVQKPRVYTLWIDAINEDGQVINTIDTEFYCGSYQYNSAQEFFGDSPIETEEQAKSQMKTINVNVWKIDKNGNKYESTVSLTIHQKLEHIVWRTFQDIFEGPEKFPIYSADAYAWRAAMSSGRLSEHNYGTAIDINSNENYCIYSNGSAIGQFWKPYENQYSITPYGDVMKAFERNGFTWGGDAWNNPKDYMHFSYLGT